MSEENVEIVRDAWRAFIERGLDGSAGYYAEDCVIEAIPEAPDRATRQGREGIRLRYEEWAEAWAELTWSLWSSSTRARTSCSPRRAAGPESSRRRSGRYPCQLRLELRDSLVVRDRPFGSKDQALEAAGLEE